MNSDMRSVPDQKIACYERTTLITGGRINFHNLCAHAT